MRSIRSPSARGVGFVDCIDYEDAFQTLELDFSPLANMSPWPKAFESHLKAMPLAALCKKLDQITEDAKDKDLSYLDHPPRSLAVSESNTKCGMPDSAEQDTTSLESEEAETCSKTFLPQVEAPRRGLHYQQFCGSGTDADRFECNGILHPLPPQNGIPGWQRITMLKYFPSDLEDATDTQSASSPGQTSSASDGSSHTSSSSTNNSSSGSSDWPSPTAFTPINGNSTMQTDPEDVDIDSSCWAYEGVVLPGGKIMLGRWWSPTQDAEEFLCMGPFIFWEVEGEA